MTAIPNTARSQHDDSMTAAPAQRSNRKGLGRKALALVACGASAVALGIGAQPEAAHATYYPMVTACVYNITSPTSGPQPNQEMVLDYWNGSAWVYSGVDLTSGSNGCVSVRVVPGYWYTFATTYRSFSAGRNYTAYSNYQKVNSDTNLGWIYISTR